ncbi:MAG: hypothetical protein JXA14_08085 [Anaerolineae bacterium]|jgi:hypothetical protein|nr:hypothetical protein [Anaerolineae bacterium]
MDERIAEVIRERLSEGMLRCADAFRIAEEMALMPLDVGEAADALEVRLARCQLGLFGYGEKKRIVQPAEQVAPELEQAIRDGLVEGRLPCAEAWTIAARFGLSKLEVASAAEKLEICIGQCQLGAF